jgi:hypothetical protein
MLGSLADSVVQLYKRIEGLYGQRPGPPRPSPPGADESAAATGGGDGEFRARKRRRVSSVDGGDNEDVTTTPPEVREDVESIKDTIREIEDRLQDVENDMTQHSRDIIEQLEAKMDEKIEEIARSADVVSLVETQLGPQTAQTLQAYSEGFAQADQEIAELAQEMADLIPRLDELQRDNDLFKQEDAADKELLAQVRTCPPSRFTSVLIPFSLFFFFGPAVGQSRPGQRGGDRASPGGSQNPAGRIDSADEARAAAAVAFSVFRAFHGSHQGVYRDASAGAGSAHPR